ncbi:potassium uptake protein, variant 2 [Verruconis gallopava]|uniref:Potassium uptake protein, variant 1 n=1 Tax=Verruconis gallopava TaxID=253628 RepID=A0A0D1XNX3_9PEZI|nr:potassium uptake protein, variant 1 [Verruconis gallopava]XP_016214146.1 potassium uptake protein, variant 2 [Verruconis gallopava]KIW04276.1 potassium uptake protein, variant 1 [Verruconis gallopava]KIW04277.1 potassium uptake protein, variant 2 [Verruconis gallopava]
MWQVFSKRELFLLAYQSIGVIYGDIGTSPLYVFSSTFTTAPNKADLMGALSLILWTIFMMVTVKYVLVILRADNEGEGGTFSTYALLSRYANISNRDPREASLVRMQRYKTSELSSASVGVRATIEKSKFLRGLLKTMGVLAVSMILSDGVLTPAQSVLGAVQGLNVAVENISKSTVVGVTCAILILLFLIQPLGVGRISMCFAPIIIIWLAWNAVFGIYNLACYDYTVLKAFNPYYAFDYLIRNGEHGWRSLGGVLLCFTGVEALFADLGAFSRKAIQLSWLCYTFPCLLLTYIGQAAYISVHPEAYSNPFYNCAPKGTVIPSLVIAILAAIVASQAIITATFQLMAQIMKLSYFPQIEVKHTSKTHYGQVYVWVVNWFMMTGTVLVAGIYNNTTSLGNAYGVCVMFVTFFDTCMVTLAAILVWKLNPYFVFIPWLIIACMDGTYLSSALTKVPDGAWFTITLAAVLASLFILWRFGKEQQWAAEAEDRFPTSHFVERRSDGKLALTEKYGGTTLSQIQGMGIFFDKAGETTPIVFSQFVRKLTTAPAVMVFFHLRPLEKPTVGPEDRYSVSRLAIPNCYRLIVRHGYMDEVISPDLASLIYEKVRDHIVRRALEQDQSRSAVASGANTPTGESSAVAPSAADESRVVTEPSIAASLETLEKAFKHQVLYIIGKEQMRVKPKTNILRSTLLHFFLFLRDNTRNKIASLKVQRDRVIEVGFIKDV